MNQAISQLILNIRQHLILVVDFIVWAFNFDKMFAYKKVYTTGVYSRGGEEEGCCGGGGCCGGDGDCC